VQIPLAARGPDFEGDLARLGMDVSYGAGFYDVISGIAEALQHGFARAEYSIDLGEIARLATIESLTGLVAPDLSSLFEPNPGEVQRAFARFSSGDAFSELAREFFTRLPQKTRGYYLSRELANHNGPDQRFGSPAERSDFEIDLDVLCREATRIIKEFAGGWLGNRAYRDGGLREQDAQAFLAIALRKLNSEFQVRRNAD